MAPFVDLISYLDINAALHTFVLFGLILDFYYYFEWINVVLIKWFDVYIVLIDFLFFVF